MNILKRIKNKAFSLLLEFINPSKVINLIIEVIRSRITSLQPERALKFLFTLENEIYRLLGIEAVKYGNGVHTKHKHIKYHDFFTNNIETGSKVLDIGCGIGALAFDIAENVNDIKIFGIDISEQNIHKAQKLFSRDNVMYIKGDALKDLPDDKYNVIILSNVLEHIKERNDFLKKIKAKYKPDKILIRVPAYERDWRVPLKDELGIDYRLDKTHFIEYRQEDFFDEMKEAGLKIKHYKVNWGEIWAEVE